MSRNIRTPKKQVSPAVIFIAVIILFIILFVAYKLTLGKQSADLTRLPAGAYTQRSGQADPKLESAWNAEKKAFICPDCRQAFRLPGLFRAHQSQVHGKGTTPPMLKGRGGMTSPGPASGR